MNIYDISEAAGVSIATVSRVINGSDKVKPATREKVLDIIEKNGYTPNGFARGLSSNTMATVGICCADSSDVYMAQGVYYLERELREHQYASMLCCTGHDLERKKEYLKLLVSRNVDAIFFIGSHYVEDTREKNQYILEVAEKLPVFILNGELEGKNIYSIRCDDREAEKILTDYIFFCGKKNPLYLMRMASYSGKLKMEGFCDSCRKNGLAKPEKRIVQAAGKLREIADVLEELQRKGMEFDSVLASDDELAVAAVKYAARCGRRIPADFEVIGYNNSVLAESSTPELTSFDNRVEYMCKTAVSQLLDVFEGRKVAQRTVFNGNIIIRETTTRKNL